MVIVSLGAGYGIREYTRGNTDLEGAAPDVRITAADLMSAYSSDEIAANARYLNKIIRVSGIIKDIKQDSLGSYSIELDAGSELAIVSCLLDKRHNEDASRMKKGEQAAITGLCTGMLLDVVLVRCAVE